VNLFDISNINVIFVDISNEIFLKYILDFIKISFLFFYSHFFHVFLHYEIHEKL